MSSDAVMLPNMCVGDIQVADPCFLDHHVASHALVTLLSPLVEALLQHRGLPGRPVSDSHRCRLPDDQAESGYVRIIGAHMCAHAQMPHM